MSFRIRIPCQSEIIWRLAGEGDPASPWHERAIRPGALFLVGDPKQAIYRFRGADVHTYLLAKKALARPATRPPFWTSPPTSAHGNRSLEYVNEHFEVMLDEDQGQPGFTPLAATRSAGDESCVRGV